MENNLPTESATVPLFVDLDGTLAKSDLLYESFLALLKSSPLHCLLIPFWLLRGKAHLKQMIAQRVDLDASHIPYNQTFLEYLRTEAEAGRKLILATASNHILANRVADHLGIFDKVIASTSRENLSGKRKLERITAESPGGSFDYAANASIDIEIWKQARHALLVNPERGVEKAARRAATVDQVFNQNNSGFIRYIKAMRVYQWMKNLLLFVPLLTAHEFTSPSLIQNELLAFLAFSLCASGVYILNDLLDLPADREHPRKQLRPFAAGDIPLLHGLVLAATLPLAGLGIAVFMLSGSFFSVLLLYLVLTSAYSLKFKAYAVLDVLLLAGLYTIRVYAGAVVIDVTLSFWLLTFSMFIFLSLALVKRCSELNMLTETTSKTTKGRGYHVSDLGHLQMMGIASGYLSILVIALYIDNPTIIEQYTHPEFLWIMCPALLFWISRIWLLTGRGQMHDDPLLFAVRDRGSQIATLTCVLAVVLSM